MVVQITGRRFLGTFYQGSQILITSILKLMMFCTLRGVKIFALPLQVQGSGRSSTNDTEEGQERYVVCRQEVASVAQYPDEFQAA